jgi:hypothetical protein
MVLMDSGKDLKATPPTLSLLRLLDRNEGSMVMGGLGLTSPYNAQAGLT